MANFKYAMNNFALPQGDIALFMNEYAECRSNTRGIIGYDDKSSVNTLLQKYDARVDKTKERFADIKETIVTKEGETAYKKIEKALDAYFKKEAEVIVLGSSTDPEDSRLAQEMALNELAPLYETLDKATIELMEINIEKEKEMETLCLILEW